MFGSSEDGFADDLIIPEDIEIEPNRTQGAGIVSLEGIALVLSRLSVHDQGCCLVCSPLGYSAIRSGCQGPITTSLPLEEIYTLLAQGNARKSNTSSKSRQGRAERSRG